MVVFDSHINVQTVMDLLHLNRAYSARTKVKKRIIKKSKPGNKDITVAALELVKIDMWGVEWAKIWHQSLPKLLKELELHGYWQKRMHLWKRIYDHHHDWLDYWRYYTISTYLKLRKMLIFGYYNYHDMPFKVRLPFLMKQFVKGGISARPMDEVPRAVYSQSHWQFFIKRQTTPYANE